MRFSDVKVAKRGDEDTKQFSKVEFAAVNNLYEIKTLASIRASEQDIENTNPLASGVKEAVVLSANNEKWLVVAVGLDISIFCLSYNVDHVTTHSLKGTDIIGLSWLLSSSILAVFKADRTVHFISANSSGIIYTQTLATTEIPLAVRATITTHDNKMADECSVVFTDNMGAICRMNITNWSKLSTMEIESREQFEKACSVNHSTAVSKVPFTDIVIQPGTMDIFAMPAMSSSVMISTGANLKFDSPFTNDINDNACFIRSRLTCHDSILVSMTTTGTIVVRDLFTNCVVHKQSILKSTEDASVVDFIFTEYPEYDFFEHTTIALIVRTKNGLELQARNLETLDIAYAVEVRDGAILLPASSNADRVMMLVEPFRKELEIADTKNAVKIREVSEALPDIRLDRLIARKQLDEAEKFAREFGLDIQKVHCARMEFMLTECLAENTEENFALLLKSMEPVQDHNQVGETCFSGAMAFCNYVRVNALLKYASSRQIKDPEILNRLARLQYVLTTYRMVTGAFESVNMDSESMWDRFICGVYDDEDGDWPCIFKDFVMIAMFKEATIVWHRHRQPIFEWLTAADVCGNVLEPEGSMVGEFTNLMSFFEDMTRAVRDNLTLWPEAVQFLETCIMPACIMDTVDVICPLLVEFLVVLTGLLERYMVDEFPTNALHAFSMIERLKAQLIEDCITPGEQAALLLASHSIAQTPDTRFIEASTYIDNLRFIERLRNVYECRLSYSSYIRLTPEEICYRILETAIKNPNNVAANVARLARPYMDEHRLNPDQTLFGYISDVSRKSMTVETSSNPWDEQCLLICNTIESFSLKCQAVLMIAKGAIGHPPFSANLERAVQAVLANPNTKVDIRVELDHQVTRMSLLKLVVSYGAAKSTIDTVLHNQQMFENFLRFILKSHVRQSDVAQRLHDCLTAMNLYRKLKSNLVSSLASSNRVYVLFGEYLQKATGVKSLIDYINSIHSKTFEEHDITVCLQGILNTLLCEIDSPVEFETQELVDCRVNIIASAESLLHRFFPDDDNYSVTMKELQSIRKLQEKYQIWANFSKVRNSVWREDVLKSFICKQERSLAEMQNFAHALCMSMDDAFCIAIDIIRCSGNAINFETVIRSALLSVHEPSQRLTETIVNGCVYLINSMPVICNDEMIQQDPEAMDNVVTVLTSLHSILTDVVSSCVRHASDNLEKIIVAKPNSSSRSLLETVLLISRFVLISISFVEQCMLSEEPERIAGNSIMGMSRRVGVFDIVAEGPISMKEEALVLLCKAAPSVVADLSSLTTEDRESLCAEMYSAWDGLFGFTFIHDQLILNFMFRVFAASLDCCLLARPNIIDELHHTSNKICENALEKHPCDLWITGTMLGSCSTPDAHRMVLGLRQIVATKQYRNPQLMMNYLRTVQFVARFHGMTEMNNQLTGSFVTSLWCKRLGKAGVNPAAVSTKDRMSMKDIDNAMDEFARAQLSPITVAEFLSRFCKESEIPLRMINYALLLISRASTEMNKSKMTELLQLAQDTLIRSSIDYKAEDAFDRLWSLLYSVSPYNYEVLGFIISRLRALLPQCQDQSQQKERERFVRGISTIFDFISANPRSSPLTPAEIDWHHLNMKLVSAENSGSADRSNKERLTLFLGCSVKEAYNNGWTSFDDVNDLSLFGQSSSDPESACDSAMTSTVPAVGEKRLPLHVFLFQQPGDIGTYLMPLVKNEMSIYNLKSWQLVLRHVQWLVDSEKFPRVALMSNVIVKKSNECRENGDDISNAELNVISNILLFSPRQLVIACVAHCFKNIMQSETKLKVLQLGMDVARGWLTDHDLVPPMDEHERLSLTEHVDRLKGTIQKERTNIILRKNGLYDSDTKYLTDDPTKLISHLYTKAIRWSDTGDIDRKEAVIMELVQANEMALVDLQSIHESLVEQWLPESVASSAEFAVDLNDTMGGGGAVSQSLSVSADETEIYPLPFYDSSITRVVHLLRVISNDQEKIIPMIQKLLRYVIKVADPSTVPGGFKTMIRTACVILRVFTEDQLNGVGKNLVKRICAEVETSHYGRLLNLANHGMLLSNFKKQEKQQLVKALTAPASRPNVQMFHMAACIVIDHDIIDRVTIEMLLNKLLTSRKRASLVALLKFCREHPGLHCCNNLSNLWARVYDQSVASVEPDAANRLSQLRCWLMFCLSCPVQGGRFFDSIISSLRSKEDQVSALLVQIAADNTKVIEHTVLRGDPLSLNMAWMAESTQNQDTPEELMTY